MLDGLRKSFGETVAVDGLSLAVPAAAFFGVVGPNGAGKTTTLRMATGLLRPDAGTVRVGDLDVWADPVEAKRRIGVLPEELHLFDRLTSPTLEVRILVRLKLALLASSLRRGWQQKVGLVIGVVYAVPMAIGAAVGLGLLGRLVPRGIGAPPSCSSSPSSASSGSSRRCSSSALTRPSTPLGCGSSRCAPRSSWWG